jgi:hypothetical protein
MHPYHYSLIHQSQGVPVGAMREPLYHLDVGASNEHSGGHMIGNGITGTKLNQTARENKNG